MATIVTYNGVEIHGAKTPRFSQSIQLDDSGTDAVFSRYSMTFEGLIHAQSRDPKDIWTASDQAPATTAANTYQAIRTALLQPRGMLVVTMGGQEIFRSVGITDPGYTNKPGYLDVDNGPKPKSVNLTHVTSNATIGPVFHVQFEIECASYDGQPGRATQANGTPEVLNNRWAIGESLDENYFTTRTIHGRLRLSNGFIYRADFYRAMCVPTLENGFKRERMDFNTSADGLNLDYVVVDKQIHTAAPWPATKMQIVHNEGTTNGASFASSCNIHLEGGPGTPKAALFGLAMRIVEDRICTIAEMNGKASASTKVVRQLNLTSYTGERNAIDVSIEVQEAIKTKGDGGFSALSDTSVANLSAPLRVAPMSPWFNQYDPRISHVPRNWGYGQSDPLSDVGAQHTEDPKVVSAIERLALYCYAQTPLAGTPHAIGQAKQASAGLPAARVPSTTPAPADTTAASSGVDVYRNPSVQPLPDASTAHNLIGQQQKVNIYTIAAADNRVTVTPSRVQMPLAVDPSSYKAGDDTCVICDIGLATATLSIHVESERVGTWPGIPKPTDSVDFGNGLKGKLLSKWIAPLPATADVLAAQKIYRVEARYTYGLNRPPSDQDAIFIGALPWMNYAQKDKQVTLGQLFQDGEQAQIGSATSSGQ